MNIRRLEAEIIRDAMLAISGDLDLSIGGPSVASHQPRRSVYLKIIRNTPDPLMAHLTLRQGLPAYATRYKYDADSSTHAD